MSEDIWDAGATPPLCLLELRFVPLDFVMHWHRCGLTADYVAAHMAYAFEARDEARAVLSMVVNELVENAVKFSFEKAHEARLLVRHYGDVVSIEVSNRAERRRVEVLRALLAELQGDGAEALFLERVSTPAAPGASTSGIGLIVLRKDHGATMSARFTEADDDLVDVTVQVLISSDQVEGT